MKLYKVRSLENGNMLHGSAGFFRTAGTTYDSIGGAKSGYTHYKQRNKWRPPNHPAEIVEYTCTETRTEPLDPTP